MLQESAAWDIRYIIREPSTSFKLYVVFLLFVCGMTSIKLLKAWRAAPPFRLSRRADNPGYLRLLAAASTNLKDWISCTFLGWGILTSMSVYDVCDRLLGERKVGSTAVLLVLEDSSLALTMALLVVLYAFLVRWHLLTRIERLRK